MSTAVNLIVTRSFSWRKFVHSKSVHYILYRVIRTLPSDLTYGASSSQIEGILGGAKVPYQKGYTCYKIEKCVFCTSNEYQAKLSKSKSIFINKKTGNFVCQKCKVYGTWSTLYNVLTLFKSGSKHECQNLIQNKCKTYDRSHDWHEFVNGTVKLSDLDDKSYKSVLEMFDLVPCLRDKIKELEVRFNNERNLLFFPMMYEGTTIGYKTLDSNGETMTFPKADCSGFLSYKNHNSSEVIVVSDIKDFIALVSVTLSHHIVCLPYGVTNLPENVLPYLEDYNKIILWLGNHFGKLNSSAQFARKLCEKRCYLIRPTESQLSAVKAVSSHKNLNQIIENAKPIWHQFVTTFSSLREDVMAEIQNIDEITGVPWTRFPKLNKILKGHRRGELTILTGPTGSGKTTFLSEYSLDLAMSNVNTLWGSFEIKNSRLVQIMLRQFSKTKFTPENLDLYNIVADKFETLPIYFLTFHGQHSITTVMNAVEHCSYIHDIAHVVVDNVQFMIDIPNDSRAVTRFWAQDYIIQCFRKFATANNCHVTLVIHPRKEVEDTYLSKNSIFGTAKAAQEADNILILQDTMSGTSGGRKYLEICKNRYAGELGRIPLTFDKASLSFETKSNSAGGAGKDEVDEDSVGVDYDRKYNTI